jgi:hypothetical protein
MAPDPTPTATRCARFPRVKRTVAAILSTWAMLLLTAPAALAKNGVGLAGPTDDKTVTFFCFGVIAFFAALVIVMSLIQSKLEKRKERRRYDLERLS